MIWKCHSCHSEIKVTDETVTSFCPTCGTKVEEIKKQPELSAEKNDNCSIDCSGNQDDSKRTICSACSPVDSLSPKDAAQDSSEADGANAKTETQRTIHCPLCNASLEEGATFCRSCRADLSSFPTVKLAGHWQRFAARNLDWFLEWNILGIITIIIQVPYSNSYVASFLYVLFIFLLDSIVYAVTGGTLGKWLFGIKIIDHINSKKISSFKYFYRNLRVLWGGLGLGIPIINLFTMIEQASRVSQGSPATYDEVLKVKSIEHNKKWYKTVIGIILLIIILFWSIASLIFGVIQEASKLQ